MFKSFFQLIKSFFHKSKIKEDKPTVNKAKIISVGPGRIKKQGYIPNGQFIELSNSDKKKILNVHHGSCIIRKDPLDKNLIWKRVKFFKKTYEIKCNKRADKIIEAYLTEDVDKIKRIKDLENILTEDSRNEIKELIKTRRSEYIAKCEEDENIKVHLIKYKDKFLNVEYKKLTGEILNGKIVNYNLEKFDKLYISNHFKERLLERIGIYWEDDFIDQIKQQLISENITSFTNEMINFKIYLNNKDFVITINLKRKLAITAIFSDWA